MLNTFIQVLSAFVACSVVSAIALRLSMAFAFDAPYSNREVRRDAFKIAYVVTVCFLFVFSLGMFCCAASDFPEFNLNLLKFSASTEIFLLITFFFPAFLLADRVFSLVANFVGRIGGRILNAIAG